MDSTAQTGHNAVDWQEEVYQKVLFLFYKICQSCSREAVCLILFVKVDILQEKADGWSKIGNCGPNLHVFTCFGVEVCIV